jgi:hypothetical protein
MHRLDRLFRVACSFLPTLGIMACVGAFPKTEGTLAIKAQHRDGRIVTTRGPITWGGLMGCKNKDIATASFELGIGSKESATINVSQGIAQLWVHPPLLGVDDYEDFYSSNSVHSIVVTPLADGLFRYSATMSADAYVSQDLDIPLDSIERISARADFVTTPIRGRGAYWIGYTPCD